MRQIESDNLVKIHELQSLEQEISIQTTMINKVSATLKAQLARIEAEIAELNIKKSEIDGKIISTKKKNWEIVSSDAQAKDEEEVRLIFDKIQEIAIVIFFPFNGNRIFAQGMT
jgi:hypothetical protein